MHKMNTRMEAIKLEGVTKEFGNTIAVNAIDLIVSSGTIHGFLGPNGAGKSTTMKILSGLLAPTSGEVFINQESLRQSPQTCKKNIGILPEFPPLYQDMIVKDYLTFMARLHSVEKSQVSSMVETAVEKLSLQSVVNRLIGNLSKGYKQRVGIAQALVHDPAIIVLDEPTSGLDPASVSEIRELIQNLANDHTIFLSSHLLNEVQLLCDHITIINKGSILKTASTTAILHEANNACDISLVLKHQVEEAIKELETITSFSNLQTKKLDERTELIVHFEESDEVIPEILKKMTEKSIKLYQVKPIHRELEDVFLRLTEEKND
jgi:ABC-2 type transport system ATP-binding protein